MKVLKLWKDVNPVESKETTHEKPYYKRDRNCQAQSQIGTARKCVYCDAKDHKSINCDKIVTPTDRKKELGIKRLCFNCTGSKHRAAESRSRAVCQNCQRKHHSSICDKASEKLLTATDVKKGTVCHLVVVVNVNGIQCRALFDTGVGRSYASAALLDRLHVHPQRTEIR